MNSNQILILLSNASLEERLLLENMLKDHTEEDKVKFLTYYNMQRKDPILILILSLIGFFGFAGIHRFVIDDIVMGLLYFCTLGFCGIGTLIDVIRYKKLSLEYNSKVAQMVYQYTMK